VAASGSSRRMDLVTREIVGSRVRSMCDDDAALISVNADITSVVDGGVVIDVVPREDSAAPIKIWVGPSSEQVLVLVGRHGQFELDARERAYHEVGNSYDEELSLIVDAVIAGQVREEWGERKGVVAYASMTICVSGGKRVQAASGWKQLSPGTQAHAREYAPYCQPE
jgi:hypothetical protein